MGNNFNKEIPTTNIKYKLIRKLGKGAFGTVYEIEIDLSTVNNPNDRDKILTDFPENTKRYALKIGNFDTSFEMESFENEIFIIANSRKENKYCYPDLLCHYLFAKDIQNNKSYLVSELMDGNLSDFINDTLLMEYMTEKGIKEYLLTLYLNMTLAIDELHKRDIIHRDIKPENILYSRSSNFYPFKLADFGLSCSLVGSNFSCSNFAGSILYLNPESVLEYIRLKELDITDQFKSRKEDDFYALGLVFYIFWSVLISRNKEFEIQELLKTIALYGYTNVEGLKSLYEQLLNKINLGIEKEMSLSSDLQVIVNYLKTNVIKTLEKVLL